MTVPVQLSAALADRYVIEREIGRGGMATVYLARDLRHERRVALKVLLPELGAMVGSERFLAEIRVTANLQHPHLLPLFDSGEADGLLYYAMPFVEGESLRARLDRERQLPVNEAVRIAVAVANALDYAHRRGVVHRDLKPENILLQDGEPAVSDFGIALAISRAGDTRMTHTGLSLGTPSYMSPEQATAERSIDARSDIYSLGCMLYEMLTGEPPHTGATAQAVIASLLTELPRPVRVLRGSVPEHVSAAIERALEKVPADRFSSAHRFGEALEMPTGAMSAAGRLSRASGRMRTYPALMAAAAVTLAALLVVGWSLLRYQRVARARTVRMAITLPARQRIPGNIGTLALSRDGGLIAYVAASDSGRQLYLRRLDQLEARPVAGSEGAAWPFFSPDGRWLAFELDGSLKKVPVAGGGVTTLADVPEFSGGSWSDDGQILFSGSDRGIWRVPAAGGQPVLVAKPDSALRGQSYLAPQLIPGTRAAVFTLSLGNASVAQAAVLSLDGARGSGTASVKRLNLLCNGAFYMSNGNLLCPRVYGDVLAYPFDVKRLAVTGAAVPVLERVRADYTGVSGVRVSGDGALVYSAPEIDRRLVLVGRDGAVESLVDAPRLYSHPRFAPDGKRLAVRIASRGKGEIWILNLRDSSMSRLNSNEDNEYPEWTPDGRRVSFGSRAGGSASDDLYWQLADGSGRAELLLASGVHVPEGVWTRGGDTLVFRATRKGNFDIFSVAVRGDRTPRPLLATQFGEWGMRLSPDGRWMAYVSDESGQAEVYVRPYPGMQGRWQVSGGGGSEPVWSPAGDEIFYRRLDQMMAVQLLPAGPGGLTVGARRKLFERRFAPGGLHAGYDVTPDGRRFVMAQSVDDRQSVIVVLGWFSDLRDGLAAAQP